MPLDLLPGENEIFKIRPSFFILAGGLLPLIIAVAGIMLMISFIGAQSFWIYFIILLVGMFVAIVIFLNWFATIYRLTNKRVENRIGVFGFKEEELAIEDIQNVDIQKTFLGQVFNYGTVTIKAAGSSREVDFVNVARAKQIADQIEDMVIQTNKTETP